MLMWDDSHGVFCRVDLLSGHHHPLKGWYWWEESSAAISRRVHFFLSLSQLQVGSRVSDVSIVKFCQEKVFHVGGTTGAGAPIRA